MGTSNWQNIPFCVEVLMKVAPQKVLDIGVGFGRWGIITREFCDVWSSRVLKKDWTVEIVGIEAFDDQISEYHKSFYNTIHIGDARDILPNLCQSRWDIVIFGDVLEHFEKEDGRKLINLAKESSDYVLINIPLGDNWYQEESYGNPYERHLSVWEINDFFELNLCRYSMFTDFLDKPFCSVVLSQTDPKCLAKSLFSNNTENTSRSSNLDQYISNLLTENNGLSEQIADLKQKVDEHIGKEKIISSEIARLQNDLIVMRKEKNELESHHNSQVSDLKYDKQALESQLKRVNDYVREVEASKGWKVVKWFWRLPLYTFIRNLIVNRSRTNNKSSSRSNPFVNSPEVEVGHMKSYSESEKKVSLATTTILYKSAISDSEIDWLDRVKKLQPEAIAIVHPDWRGIHAATEELFQSLLNIPDTVDPISALHYADLLAETECPRIVFSGFPLTYRYLVTAIRKRIPTIKLFVLYHGSFNKYREDYDRFAINTFIELAKLGKINKVGFVKAGMADTIKSALGISTGFVMNFIEKIPSQSSNPLPGGPHLGMWLLWSGNWQKPPFAMMAASTMIPGSILHGSDADDNMASFAKIFKVRTEFVGKPLEHYELLEQMAQMNINLYVTFHECAPMQPLESLSIGVPCLLGPVSHFFEDHSYLHDRLVVPYPDRAEIIARYAISAIEERDEIIHAYSNYAPEYNQRARNILRKFLEID